MTEKGITKAALEKSLREIGKQNAALEEGLAVLREAIAPLIPIARTMVGIHERRRTKSEAGIDIGVRFDALQRIAALGDDDG